MAARKSDRDTAIQSHIYRLPNGNRAVSVTAVVGFPDNGKSIGFAHAAARLAQKGIWFEDEWNYKRDRGTRIHDHMEAFARGSDVDALDDELPILGNLSSAWDHFNIEVVSSECIVLWYQPCPVHHDAFVKGCAWCERPGYGGRFDLIAWLTVAGVRSLWLLDLKTGKQYPLEVTLQLNAYAGGRLGVYDETGAIVRLDPLPPIEHLGALYVNEDGFHLAEVPKGDEWLDHFIALLNVKTTHAALEKSIATYRKDQS